MGKKEIIMTVIIGIVYATPNFFNTSKQDQSLNFLPGKKINLGLDLKGGSYLLLKADMDVVFAEKLETLLQQRQNLSKAINQLLSNISKGNVIIATYKQMKMYNDESLNPELYSKDD